ncbi:MAG TPA: glycoside hydrolase family 88 protein [Verrucomicrobiota bacterium]|nr:glycoside hydrolase family 88 protein [Verrucomicrobiota bacterium]
MKDTFASFQKNLRNMGRGVYPASSSDRPAPHELKHHQRPTLGTRAAVCLLSLIASILFTGRASAADLTAFVNEQYAFAATQYEGMLKSLEGQNRFPRSYARGRLALVGPRDWTSGFFPGSLWLLHEHTGDPKWKAHATNYTQRLEAIKSYGETHDLGFMLYCSYGNGYRLTRDPAYRDVLIAGARTLASRFNPTVGLIRSWDWGTWKYPVIIDNMMNLELLMFAHKETGEDMFRDVAIKHADTTLKNHFRPDNSTFHVVDYDPATGAILSKETRQGYNDASAWARGQTWGLYGYVMMHRETKNVAYLDQARKIAEFLIHHTNMPSDKVPYWDFNAPGIPNEPRDASAAAIMASALLELSDFVEPADAARYREFATAQLRSLASPAYRANPGENGHFLLMHGVGDLPRQGEVDAPLVYADYYFLEALSRLKTRSSAN